MPILFFQSIIAIKIQLRSIDKHFIPVFVASVISTRCGLNGNILKKQRIYIGLSTLFESL
jgi:hypothetical protein